MNRWTLSSRGGGVGPAERKLPRAACERDRGEDKQANPHDDLAGRERRFRHVSAAYVTADRGAIVRTAGVRSVRLGLFVAQHQLPEFDFVSIAIENSCGIVALF